MVKCEPGYTPKRGDVFHSDFDCQTRYLVISDAPAEGREAIDWSTGKVVKTYAVVTYDASLPPSEQKHVTAFLYPEGSCHIGSRELKNEDDA
jgi:hypothetical protein